MALEKMAYSIATAQNTLLIFDPRELLLSDLVRTDPTYVFIVLNNKNVENRSVSRQTLASGSFQSVFGINAETEEGVGAAAKIWWRQDEGEIKLRLIFDPRCMKQPLLDELRYLCGVPLFTVLYISSSCIASSTLQSNSRGLEWKRKVSSIFFFFCLQSWLSFSSWYFTESWAKLHHFVATHFDFTWKAALL